MGFGELDALVPDLGGGWVGDKIEIARDDLCYAIGVTAGESDGSDAAHTGSYEGVCLFD